MGAIQYRRLIVILLAILVAGDAVAAEKSWWKKEWTVRKKVTIDPAASGITEAVGTPTILLRLHDGNFNFGAGKEDGSDIRAVSEDDKTVLASGDTAKEAYEVAAKKPGRHFLYQVPATDDYFIGYAL